jgi:hypothetical protein
MAALTGFHATKVTRAGPPGTSYLRSMFFPMTGRFFCLFEGPSVEAVELANDEAGLPYKAVTPATDPLRPG